MKHICEICNKQYDTVAGAERCELAHKKEALEASMKASSEAAISNAINAHIAKFKEIPVINITHENLELLFGDMAKKFEKSFDTLIGILCDDEDECEELDCESKKCDCHCKSTSEE